MLKHFIKKDASPPLDIEKIVGNYLLTLPRCTSRVLVVGSRYLDNRFNFEMIVNSASLVTWAESHDKGAWSSDIQEQAARKSLPMWLRMADTLNQSVSYPPAMFIKVMSGYHETFLDLEGTKLLCNECHCAVDNPIQKSTHLPSKEIFDVWRYEWHCPQGHLLYLDEVGRHAVPSRARVISCNETNELSIPSFLRKQSE